MNKTVKREVWCLEGKELRGSKEQGDLGGQSYSRLQCCHVYQPRGPRHQALWDSYCPGEGQDHRSQKGGQAHKQCSGQVLQP